MTPLDLGFGNGRIIFRPRPVVNKVTFLAAEEEVAHRAAANTDNQSLELARRSTMRRGSRCQPLPQPTGEHPFHLQLQDVLAIEDMARIAQAGKLVFHVLGDTGGLHNDAFQRRVAKFLENDCDRPDPANKPAFLFHLGDVIYVRGEAASYYSQFYDAYEHYPAPIFAIPGNHDGEFNSGVPSLEAFVRNFCSREPHPSPDALDVERDTMTQPNVYFSLHTPLATIIGLYSNVPEGGIIEADQVDWLIAELQHAPADRALLIAVHHPVFSADTHHGGSPIIKKVLERAMAASRRVPHLILNAHVHNYQRYTWHIGDRDVPTVVAGAGGYRNLHSVARLAGRPLHTPYRPPGSEATLEAYVDDRHGFLRLEVTASKITGKYYAVPTGTSDRPDRMDVFHLDLAKHRLTHD